MFHLSITNWYEIIIIASLFAVDGSIEMSRLVIDRHCQSSVKAEKDRWIACRLQDLATLHLFLIWGAETQSCRANTQLINTLCHI